MNDNVPESERWVPLTEQEISVWKDSLAQDAIARDRARRDAEAMIAKHFPPR